MAKIIDITINKKELFKYKLGPNDERITECIKQCDAAIEELEYHKKKIIKAVYPEFDYLYQTPGIRQWRCKESPAGVCIYDLVDDPIQDDCIFCHQPNERK